MPIQRRNQATPELAAKAALAGDFEPLKRLLLRNSCFPGPRPNFELGWELGREIAKGRASVAVVDNLLQAQRGDAKGQAPELFQVVVAAACAAHWVLAGVNSEQGWRLLHDLAGDSRQIIRDGVVAALQRYGESKPARALKLPPKFASWTDGFLHSAVALEVLRHNGLLEQYRQEPEVFSRVREAFELSANVRRADMRSQGRRQLLIELGRSLPVFAHRNRDVLEWLPTAAHSSDPEIRKMFEEVLRSAAKAGVPIGDLDPVRAALDESAAPLRDPTDYRGNTRGRGRKAARRKPRR